MIIEDKLSAVPTCEHYHDACQRGQEDTIGQNRRLVTGQAVSPIGAEQSEQRHCDDRVGPSRRSSADTAHEQKLEHARKAREHAKEKSSPGRPNSRSCPEGISGPPVQDISTEGAKCQRDRESDTHGVDRVVEDGNARLRGIIIRSRCDRINQFLVFFLNYGIGHSKRLLLVCLGAIALLALPACQGALSTMQPAGPAARDIATLWWVMLAGSTLIVTLVAGLLWRGFRRPAGADERTKITDEKPTARMWIVGLGIVFPMVVLAALLGYALIIGERLLPRNDEAVIRVEARAQQWSWSFAYADRPGYVTESVLHIPAGRPVDVSITTSDVIHSFWVPRLAGKLDAIPGRVNVLRIEADSPGTYFGQSAEFSGVGYAGHTFEVRAHDATGWSAFVAGDAP